MSKIGVCNQPTKSVFVNLIQSVAYGLIVTGFYKLVNNKIERIYTPIPFDYPLSVSTKGLRG